MKNNYKLILCLLVVIIASMSCVAASEDADTSQATGNNGDTSIPTLSGLDVGSDESLEVNSIDNRNNNNGNGGVDLNTDKSGDSDTSYEKHDGYDGDLKSATKSVPVSNDKHANLYNIKAATYQDSNELRIFHLYKDH